MKARYLINAKYLSVLFSISFFLLIANEAFAQEFTFRNSNGQVISLKAPAAYIKENDKLKSFTAFDDGEMLDLIVTLKAPPLCLRKSGVLAKASDVKAEHVAFKSQVQQWTASLKKTNSAQSGYKINREFYSAINAIAMQCTRRVMTYIQTMPMVKAVHENITVKATLNFSVAQIKADKVRNELSYTGRGILVGIIDTGIDYNNPALGGGIGAGYRVIGGYDFFNDDNDPMDDHSHGTHVAGIIGANADSLRGVAPDVSFLAVKVLSKSGEGTEAGVLAGIEYCLDPDGNPDTDDAVDIINMSLGGTARPDNPVDEAVNNATQAGILSVIAAGNDGYDFLDMLSFETISSPGTAASALTVGACDGNFNMANFSSKGPDPINLQIKPEIIAPGVNIKSLVLDNKTERYSGTSMATPHVAGAAALLKQQHPDWTPTQLKWALVNSTQPLHVQEYNPYQQGNGCVDSWHAAHRNVIIEPGVLSFGIADLMMNTWRDTVSFTIQNLSNDLKTYTLSRRDNIPSTVQLNFSHSSIDIPAQSSAIVTAEIVVPQSVPVLNEAPYAYYGEVFCSAANDTITLPYGFVKANQIVIECDLPPSYINISNSDSRVFYSNDVQIVPGQTKYTVRNMAGTFDFLFEFFKFENPDNPDAYIVQRSQVPISGLTYFQIEHSEARFNCFPGPYYTKNGELLTENDKCEFSTVLELTLSKSAPGISTSNGIGLFGFPNIWITALDPAYTFSHKIFYKKDNELFAISNKMKGIQSQADLIIPTGADHLGSLNIKFAEPDDSVSDQTQSLYFASYELFIGNIDNHAVTSKSSIGREIDLNLKLTVNKEMIVSEDEYFSNNYFDAIQFSMEQQLTSGAKRIYFIGDFAINQDNQIIQFDRNLRVKDRYLVKRRLSEADTIIVAPNEDFQLPIAESFYVRQTATGNNMFTDNKGGTLSLYTGGIVSSQGVWRDEMLFDREQNIDYRVFNNGIDCPLDIFSQVGYHLPLTTNSILVRGTTDSYSLLGQTGYSTVENEINLQKMEIFRGMYGDSYSYCTPPFVDNLMVFVNDKAVQRVTPAQDGIIKINTYDMGSDFKDISMCVIPASGEEIPLVLETIQDKLEYHAHIPNNLPHEFIDIVLRMNDKQGNKTTYTAAPAFYFGESDAEIVANGRVWLNHYHLQNAAEFPFTTGDTLVYALNYLNVGGIQASNVYLKFPTTSMFAPLGADSVALSLSNSASVELKLHMLQDNPSDTFLVYCPEVHWTSVDKPYMRQYPLRIKTLEQNTQITLAGNDVTRQLTYQLMNNYPNPFNPSTNISYRLPVAGNVRLIIYNILGQKVKTLMDSYQNAGVHSVIWDATDERNNPVSSGIYFYQMKTENQIQQKKMMLVR